MYEQVNKPKNNKSRTVVNSVAQKKSKVKKGFKFVDNRSKNVVQRVQHLWMMDLTGNPEQDQKIEASKAKQQERSEEYRAKEAKRVKRKDLDDKISAVVLGNNWNNHDLVTKIGKQPWSEIKEVWDSIDAKSKEKYILVKLRGKPYDKQNDTVESYEGLTDNFMGKQQGYMWGTETEGGGVTVKLKAGYQGNDEKKVTDLKEALTTFKRTPLIQTDSYTLALDNVMDKITDLIKGKVVSLPLEIASKPISGKLAINTDDKANVMKQESRKRDTWPMLSVNAGKAEIKTGKSMSLDKFNHYFMTTGVQNIPFNQKPQHVTKSGEVEDRLKMARELLKTAKAFEPGTKGKKALSGMPKTSVELLRHSAMSKGQVKELEAIGYEIREILRQKLSNVVFADDVLNAIIMPKGGAPREIGGYTIATPMTNSFPLLDKGNGKVSVLREFR